MRQFTKYPSNYIKASADRDNRVAMQTQARDFYDVDVTSLQRGDIVNVNGLDWRLSYIEKFPRAIHYNFINDDSGRKIQVTKTPGHPEWLRMSSFDSSLNVDVAIDTILNSDKPCVYTLGVSYRNPTTYRVPISKEEAIRIIKGDNVVDVEEQEDVFHINAYSGNDLW